MRVPSAIVTAARAAPVAERARAWPWRIAAPVALAALALLRERVLLFEGRIQADYDTFVYFYPLHAYAAERLAAGQLPLWNPRAFLGTPLLANPQVALFYPFTLLFNLVTVPFAYSLSLTLHLALAGLLFFAYAQATLGVGRLGALLGALAFMLGGFLAGQAGHMNQVETAAWLPLLLLLGDRAIRRRSPALAAAAAVVLALQLLAGHPQEAYMALVVVGIWVVCCMPAATLRQLGVALAALAGITALGAGLAAVQLLPTLSLARIGIRGGGIDYADAVAVSLPLKLLPRALLPELGAPLPSTEYLGHIGVIPLALALLALALARHRAVVPLALVVALGLFLAIGDANPLYPLLFKLVPGLSAFRVPARWLFVVSFGLASLAAIGLDVVRHGLRPTATPRARWAGVGSHIHRWLTPASLLRVVAVGLSVLALLVWQLRGADPVPRRIVAEWAWIGMLTLTLAFIGWRLRRREEMAALLVVLTALELWLERPVIPPQEPIPAAAYGDPRSSTLFLQSLPTPGRMLSVAREDYEVKETPDYQKQYATLPPQALYNFLVATKWNEILMPNLPTEYGLDSADGYDGGVLPLKDFVELSSVLIPPERVRSDGVLLSRLTTIPERRYLDLLNLRYILDNKIKDATVDGITYDRSIEARLEPGQMLELRRLPTMPANQVGLISALAGVRDVAAGTPVGTLELEDAAGDIVRILLRAGWETADEQAGPQGLAPGSRLTVVHPSAWTAPGQPEEYLARIDVPRHQWRALRVRASGSSGVLAVRAASLIDTQAGHSESLVLDDHLRRTLFFDMKVYEYPDVLPRAYLVHRAAVLDDDRAVQAMRAPDFDPRRQVLLAPGPGAAPLDAGTVAGEDVAIETLEPEYVRLRLAARQEGWLVLADAYTPDWTARLDGRETPVARADLLLRAVRVPPGEHVVELWYTPRSLLLGAGLTALSLLSVVALAAWPLVRARRERSHRGGTPAGGGGRW